MDPRLMTTVVIWTTYICSNPKCGGKARRPKNLTDVICPDCNYFMNERK